MEISEITKQAAEKIVIDLENYRSMDFNESERLEHDNKVKHVFGIIDAVTAKLREELEIWEKSSLRAAELPGKFTVRKVRFERQRCDYELYYGSQFICAGLYAGAADKLAFELNNLLAHQQPSRVKEQSSHAVTATTPDVEKIARELEQEFLAWLSSNPDKPIVSGNGVAIAKKYLAQACEPLVAALEWYATVQYPDDGSGRPPEAYQRRAKAALRGEK